MNRRIQQLMLIPLTAALLCGLPLAGKANPPHTGAQGTAIINFGPEHDDPPPGVDPSAFTVPTATAFTIYTAKKGKEVMRAQTGADGAFALSLHPGDYLLVVDPLPGTLLPEHIYFRVRARHFTPVPIIYSCDCVIHLTP